MMRRVTLPCGCVARVYASGEVARYRGVMCAEGWALKQAWEETSKSRPTDPALMDEWRQRMLTVMDAFGEHFDRWKGQV